ncbi:hypothetical protein HK100_005875 [Physocladia obscura]|uniref:Uncharacterized protein n=1 Tax=Physocladia obscura TaxID=109957 RepID=A0AAD5T6B1_9FUNG|nr:hypothetical protein HK100_005875 [Physocladia obscura]
MPQFEGRQRFAHAKKKRDKETTFIGMATVSPATVAVAAGTGVGLFGGWRWLATAQVGAAAAMLRRHAQALNALSTPPHSRRAALGLAVASALVAAAVLLIGRRASPSARRKAAAPPSAGANQNGNTRRRLDLGIDPAALLAPAAAPPTRTATASSLKRDSGADSDSGENAPQTQTQSQSQSQSQSHPQAQQSASDSPFITAAANHQSQPASFASLIPPSLHANGFGADFDASSRANLSKKLIRAIIDNLLDATNQEPPTSAFQDVVGAGHKGAIAVRSSTGLPPFHAQIVHILTEIRGAKQRGRPLLVEGPAGLGKGTALRQFVSDESASRPAVFLQLANVLRKRHGSSSVDEADEDEGFFDCDNASTASNPATIAASASTASAIDNNFATVGAESLRSSFSTDSEMEGEERVVMSVKQDAWINALKSALGYTLPLPDLHFLQQQQQQQYQQQRIDQASSLAYNRRISSSISSQYIDVNKPEPVDMTPFHHIAQALRVIASGAKSVAPVLLVIDDVQLLFRDRAALTEQYEGIPQVFEWLLRCDVEGILDVVFCASEKSAVGALKRLRGYDWAIKLHALESVDDETMIAYLLKEVNPFIKEPNRRFTEETAALFVSTFDNSLLELDNYFRDTFSDINAFIAKRERSFLQSLKRHIPKRTNHATTATAPTSSPSPTPSYLQKQNNRFSIASTTADLNPAQAALLAKSVSPEEELRALFLEIMMRGGVLPVARLDVSKMGLVENLVERNILRWRDARVRKRENRQSLYISQTATIAAAATTTTTRDHEDDDAAVGQREIRFRKDGRGMDRSYVSVRSAVSASGSGRRNVAGGGGGGGGGVYTPAGRNDSWFGMSVSPSQAWADIDRDGSAKSIDAVTAENVNVGGNNWWSVAVDGGFGDYNDSNDISEPHDLNNTGFINSSNSTSSSPRNKFGNLLNAGGIDLDNDWAGATSGDQYAEDEITQSIVKDMDAGEQLAFFAMEDAELVWSNGLVRNKI